MPVCGEGGAESHELARAFLTVCKQQIMANSVAAI